MNTMTTVADIAGLIVSRRRQLDAIMRSDLVQLQVQYGDRVVMQALELADRAALEDQLSITGAKQRRAEQRQDRKAVQRALAAQAAPR